MGHSFGRCSLNVKNISRVRTCARNQKKPKKQKTIKKVEMMGIVPINRHLTSNYGEENK